MKITIEIDENCIEDEVIIRCREVNESISKLNKMIADVSKKDRKLTLYKQEKEFYIEVSEILFFESESDGVRAHTKDDVFIAKYKLYELENILPSEFCRISKSTIVNAMKIYAITRNITASSLVEFENTNKKVYASRSYYKNLKEIMNEKR
ncbi:MULTISPECIES: LytTR family DNA-binding domain-containing protein [Eubacterium]|jgi:DNA-binding LytR/AlgR family response regulator|uniref:Transcriptional regulator, LytTR family n=1 Tax=Eubacterium uniforme TaxID=39495 RepID=A0A1T4W0K5_9FIRM|nr:MULTISPECIES: LytTR family DNA-binding domain-containing protein [Eubacterium]MCR5629460.1 LytTR family transcriptional regulator [Eubacterium sp.]SKA70261.1 transcriptional regulator, LytTR family [Eubacterium uniforme]